MRAAPQSPLLRAPLGPVDLPRWKSRNDRDKVLMTQWVHRQLETQIEEDLRSIDPGHFRAWLADHGPQHAEALNKNIEPLKALLRSQHPTLAKFADLLRPLARKRGQKKVDLRPKFDVAGVACRDLIPRIRAIWKKHYGKVNRPKGDLTAMEIAASYVEIPVRKIERKRKKGARRSAPR
jgi:hypothetical protein